MPPRPASAPPAPRGKDAADEEPKPAKKSSRRTCKVCAYSWIDKYGKPQCPKCLRPMTDGFSFLDTEIGQQMQKRMKETRKRLRSEEKQQRTEINAAVKRGHEKAEVLWRELKQRLEDPNFGGGLTFDERIAIAMEQKQYEFSHQAHERRGMLRNAQAKGRARSVEEWKGFRAMLDTSGTRRKCHKCFYKWTDKYGKPDCPKCWTKLFDGVKPTRNENFVLQWWHIMPTRPGDLDK